ncbi:YdcF family protein [Mucilaginibacter phyllosphaerae]|uniref:Uncharacterized SAM-binding protein YcdF (DUF218 family) n=1 Tax=Mucilaginibacter phyllosphaerae TaxID=1812349 RepID=A0A4Y8A5R2_9SPHI|nr:YdcF family protein [Mucilaginibacter phyllosphaerae]MBB3971001.1 uncharacterized SAM-binding protein YcdF (DUF218 family) [Mucilaginibacter phyllosphaerae]TEW63746.1 YdcF family protein [Mucilaginibacter phyllosphaerae]GGH21887.1 hypothetical protein GCM10007352_34860 [Mucilaginibacter phyllosphaerae]
MYFLLSKLLLVFIMPLTWCMALLLYAVFIKNTAKKQKLIIIALAMLYFFSNKFTADVFARMWDVAPYSPLNKTYTAAILLGGFVSKDEEGVPFFNWTVERYNQTLKLYHKGIVKKVLFTGGNADLKPDGFTEASYVKSELIKAGVPDSLILIDDKARNTAENAAYSKQLLQTSGLRPPYLLVTSAFHMRRARLIFKKAGIDFIPYPCQYMTAKHFTPGDFIPGVDAMSQWGLYIKEVIGYLVALFR